VELLGGVYQGGETALDMASRAVRKEEREEEGGAALVAAPPLAIRRSSLALRRGKRD